MAQYDGSIRINTKIDTKNAEIQLSSLENRMVKTADKVASLRSKLDSLKNTQIPTQEYKEIASDISKAEAELAKLVEKQSQMQIEGKDSGAAWDRINQKIQASNDYIDFAKSEMQELVDSSRAFTVGDPAEIEKVSQQLRYEEERLSTMTEKRDLLNAKIQAQTEEEQRLADIKENATVADQELVDLLERRRQLLDQIKDLEKSGVTEGYQEYDTAFADIADVQSQINSIRDMRDAAAEARESYVGLGETIRTTFRTMARGLIDIPIAAMKTAVNGLVSGFQKLGNVAKNVAAKSFRLLGTSIKSALSKAGSMVGNIVSKLKTLGSTAKKSFGDMNRSAKKSGGTLGTLASRFKGIALSFLLFNQITKDLNASVKAMKEGFGNLYKDNERFQNSVNELKASVLTLKNAFAAAFRPLVDVAIPYIQMAADKLTDLLNKVGQFTAAITGQKTYTKAIKQTADAFKEVKKAAESYLSPLDEIHRYSDGTGNDGDENQFGLMFEELPIEQKFSDMAKKVKDVLKDLFTPIKEAWNREGEFVIDSWKYGLEEVGKLLKDVGRDFLEVWKQPATIAMLQDILHIFGDIGLIVGNLAAKFREAWNENNVGLHILENIRDIFAVIVHNIREAADYTVEWTKTLDFTPLLQGIERLTASIVPFFDFLSGTLSDFYTEFLLPLASWTLSEQGIPRLLNVLADFMESVDWQGLRNALKELYGALEPYAEKIGTGLIDFIERMKEYGVEFLNFLPEHIQAAADSLRNGDLPGAFEEFGTISGKAVSTAFNFIRDSINSIPWGEIGTWIASYINGIDWNGVFESLFGSVTTALNSAIDLIYNFITETDWGSIGAAFGTNLSNAWQNIDWAKLGGIVSEGIKSIFDFLLQAIDNIDWYEIGRKVGEFLSNIDWIGIISRAFTLLTTLPSVLWEALSGTASAINWEQLVTDITDRIKDFFTGFDWAGLGETVSDAFESFLGFMQSVIEKIDWDGIGNKVGTFLSSIDWQGIFEKITDSIKTILSGLISGLGETTAGKFVLAIGTVIATIKAINIIGKVMGFVNLFSSVFGGLVPIVSGIVSAIGPIITSIGTVLFSPAGLLIAGIIAGVALIVANWDKIKEAATVVCEWVSEKWGDLKEKTSEIWKNVSEFLSNTWETIKTAVANTWETIKTTLSGIWDGLKTTAETVFGGIRNTLQEVWDNIKSAVESVWESISSKISGVIDTVKGKIDEFIDKVTGAAGEARENGRNIVEGLKNGLLDAWESLKQTVGDIASGITEKFKSVLGIHSPSKVMDENGVYIMEGLGNGIGGSVSGIIELFNNLKNSIVEIMKSLGQMVAKLSQEMGRYMLEAWKQVLSGTMEACKGISEIISKTTKTMGETLISSMANAGQKWSTQWKQIGEIVSNVCRNIVSTVSGMVSNIRSMLSEISRSIESTKAAASSVSSSLGSTYSAHSYSMRSMPSPYAANPAFAALNSEPIPKLATGAVIPANREFLAVLGDQKHGTNIEAPLDTIMQANEQLLTKAMMQLGTMGGSMTGTPQTVKVQVLLDRKVIGESTVDWGKIQQMSTGNNPFLLGNT